MKHLLAFFLGIAAANAAPLGVNPGQTDLTKAKTLLGDPRATPLAEARYQFFAPVGSGFSAVELYVGRQSKVVEIAQYRYEPVADPVAIKTQLKQKDPDLRYNLASGDSCEVFFGAKVRLIINKEGKAKSIEYLSTSAMQLLLTELAPFKPDRSTPTGAYQAFVASLFTKKESELTASIAKGVVGLDAAYLQSMRATILLALDGASVTPPAPKFTTKLSFKVNQAGFGATEFIFVSGEKGWGLSQINGLSTILEKAPSTPRAALVLYLKSLASKTPPKGAQPDVSAMSSWGADWFTTAEKMPITDITIDGAKASITLSLDGKSAQATCLLEGKAWRVTEVKPQ